MISLFSRFGGAIALEARLRGVDGFTGRGAIEFRRFKGGSKKLAVALRGIAGCEAEIFADGKRIDTVVFDNGRAAYRCECVGGSLLPDLAEGAQIEIRQNGRAILQGVFAVN